VDAAKAAQAALESNTDCRPDSVTGLSPEQRATLTTLYEHWRTRNLKQGVITPKRHPIKVIPGTGLRGPKRKGTSRYFGVSRRGANWRAMVRSGSLMITLGRGTEVECAQLVNNWLIEQNTPASLSKVNVILPSDGAGEGRYNCITPKNSGAFRARVREDGRQIDIKYGSLEVCLEAVKAWYAARGMPDPNEGVIHEKAA
jgi:hypothetical protein